MATKKLEKITKDRILKTKYSPLRDEMYPEWDGLPSELGEADTQIGFSTEEETLVVSGELGKGGHPVTITVLDEVTGQEMEISHIKNALIMLEDERPHSSGWLSLMIGDVKRIGEILSFVAKATVKELKRMVKR